MRTEAANTAGTKRGSANTIRRQNRIAIRSLSLLYTSQKIANKHSRMEGRMAMQILHLLPAGRAGGDQNILWLHLSDRGQQAAVRDRHRDIVVAFAVSE